jgi:hypothetical protein
MKTTLKVLTIEKRGGLAVVSFDRSRFKLFSRKLSNKFVLAPSLYNFTISCLGQGRCGAGTSVADPNPWGPYVFGPLGSGSIGQRYGSGSFYRQAKNVRKTLIPTVL